MTKLERARAIATAEGLPEWQNDYMGTVLDQLLTVGLNFYETNVKEVLGDGVPLITMTPEQANEQARAFGKILLVFALDLAHTMQEENKEGKERHSPHTPYREKSPDTKEESSHTLPRACARTRTGKSRGRKKVAFPPSIEDVYAHADERGIPRMFADYWHDKEEKALLWRDKRTHRTIKHTWRDVFESYWCYAESDELWTLWQKDHTPKTPPEEEKHYNLLGEVK